MTMTDRSAVDAEDFIEGLTFGQARRAWIFWLITLSGACIAGLGTGLLFHHVSILAGNGIPRDVAALLFVPLGVVTAVSNLTTGWLVDRESRSPSAAELPLAGARSHFPVSESRKEHAQCRKRNSRPF